MFVAAIKVAPMSAKEKWTEKQYAPTFIGAWRRAASKMRDGVELTQEDLAAEIGISNGHLSKLEIGKRQYTQEILEAAVKALRVYFPKVTVTDLIAVDPNSPEALPKSDPVAVELADRMRRIPHEQRDVAERMLNALSDRDRPIFRTKPSAPVRKTRKKRS